MSKTAHLYEMFGQFGEFDDPPPPIPAEAIPAETAQLQREPLINIPWPKESPLTERDSPEDFFKIPPKPHTNPVEKPASSKRQVGNFSAEALAAFMKHPVLATSKLSRVKKDLRIEEAKQLFGDSFLDISTVEYVFGPTADPECFNRTFPRAVLQACSHTHLLLPYTGITLRNMLRNKKFFMPKQDMWVQDLLDTAPPPGWALVSKEELEEDVYRFLCSSLHNEHYNEPHYEENLRNPFLAVIVFATIIYRECYGISLFPTPVRTGVVSWDHDCITLQDGGDGITFSHNERNPGAPKGIPPRIFAHVIP